MPHPDLFWKFLMYSTLRRLATFWTRNRFRIMPTARQIPLNTNIFHTKPTSLKRFHGTRNIFRSKPTPLKRFHGTRNIFRSNPTALKIPWNTKHISQQAYSTKKIPWNTKHISQQAYSTKDSVEYEKNVRENLRLSRFRWTRDKFRRKHLRFRWTRSKCRPIENETYFAEILQL